MSTKNVKKESAVKNVNVASGNDMAWMKNFDRDRVKAEQEMRKNGIYFQGEKGETVRGVFNERNPRMSETKNGTPMYQINVIRMDVAKEQQMGWPPFVSNVMNDIMRIAQAHKGNMLDVVFDATFTEKNGRIVLASITEVTAPQVAVVAEEIEEI